MPYPKYQSYQNNVSPWLGDVPTEWAFERGKWLHGYSKVLNSNGENQNVLSLTLRGVVNNDPENPEGLIPSDYRTYQLFDKGNLVFKLIDLDNIKTSRVGLVHENGIMSSAYIRIIPSDGTDPKFLFYFYYHLYQGEVFNKLGSGVRSTMNKSDLLDLPVPALPMETQTAIASFLDEKTAEIEALVRIKRQQIELLAERKQILIQNAVTKGLNSDASMKDSKIDWIGTIPAHWEATKLRYLGTFQNGISAGAEYFGSGYPFVTYGDVYNNSVLPSKPSGLAKSSTTDRVNYSILDGDVLFTRTSEVANDIGVSSTCLETIENASFSGFVIRMRPATKSLKPKYSSYLFRCMYISDFFAHKMNIVIRASLGQELLKNLPIFLPPLDEQEEIIAHCTLESERMDAAITIKQNQIIKLNEYKTTLINAAVTGKIKVA